jgi:RNA polymerase sigma-70 factor (ECF subfamily)
MTSVGLFLVWAVATRYHSRTMDEAALIRDAQRGDLDSFNRLVLVYQTPVYNLAYRIMGEGDSAADAAQEAFLAAYRSLRGYRGGSFRGWLLRIVTNACYDELRRRKRRPSTSLDALSEAEGDPSGEDHLSLASHEESPESAAERAELARALQDCLNHLPPEFRVVAVLADVQGFEYREVAQALGKPLGTVKSRLARARLRMRECLERFRELFPSAFRLETEATP